MLINISCFLCVRQCLLNISNRILIYICLNLMECNGLFHLGIKHFSVRIKPTNPCASEEHLLSIYACLKFAVVFASNSYFQSRGKYLCLMPRSSVITSVVYAYINYMQFFFVGAYFNLLAIICHRLFYIYCGCNYYQLYIDHCLQVLVAYVQYSYWRSIQIIMP